MKPFLSNALYFIINLILHNIRQAIQKLKNNPII